MEQDAGAPHLTVPSCDVVHSPAPNSFGPEILPGVSGQFARRLLNRVRVSRKFTISAGNPEQGEDDLKGPHGELVELMQNHFPALNSFTSPLFKMGILRTADGPENTRHFLIVVGGLVVLTLNSCTCNALSWHYVIDHNPSSLVDIGNLIFTLVLIRHSRQCGAGMLLSTMKMISTTNNSTLSETINLYAMRIQFAVMLLTFILGTLMYINMVIQITTCLAGPSSDAFESLKQDLSDDRFGITAQCSLIIPNYAFTPLVIAINVSVSGLYTWLFLVFHISGSAYLPNLVCADIPPKDIHIEVHSYCVNLDNTSRRLSKPLFAFIIFSFFTLCIFVR
jgi:hypothetical protein